MEDFTSIQKQAIYNISTLMMSADGRISTKEADYWRKIATLLGMTETEKLSSMSMNHSEAINALRSMSASCKIIAIKIFAEMMLVDGNVDKKEKQLLDNLYDSIGVEQAAILLNGINLRNLVAPYNP